MYPLRLLIFIWRIVRGPFYLDPEDSQNGPLELGKKDLSEGLTDIKSLIQGCLDGTITPMNMISSKLIEIASRSIYGLLFSSTKNRGYYILILSGANHVVMKGEESFACDRTFSDSKRRDSFFMFIILSDVLAKEM